MLPTDAKERKNLPIYSGFMRYFPDAIAAVAAVSKAGNDQHNPGERLHWSREKSSDHEDCLARHLLGLGTLDDDGQLHSAKLAWRAMAILQLEIEAYDLDLAEARDAFAQSNAEHESDKPRLSAKEWATVFGNNGPLVTSEPDNRPLITPPVVEEVTVGDKPMVLVKAATTTSATCYIAGPMRGYDGCNFKAFDRAKETLEQIGYAVISPADLDRAQGIDPNTPGFETKLAAMTPDDWKVVIARDIEAILSLNPANDDAICLLEGWEQSTGAVAEAFFARWCGLHIIDEHGTAYLISEVWTKDLIASFGQYLLAKVEADTNG